MHGFCSSKKREPQIGSSRSINSFPRPPLSRSISFAEMTRRGWFHTERLKLTCPDTPPAADAQLFMSLCIAGHSQAKNLVLSKAKLRDYCEGGIVQSARSVRVKTARAHFYLYHIPRRLVKLCRLPRISRQDVYAGR